MINDYTSRGILITFSGLDGSGKSTTGKQVSAFLEKVYGLHCSFVWCKFGDRPFLRFRPINHTRKSKIGSNDHLSDKFFLKSPFHFTYGKLLLTYHLEQIRKKVTIPLSDGVVICDRYIFDTIVDLQQEMGFREEQAINFFKKRAVPLPNKSFLFDLPAELAFFRKSDTRSIPFLEDRRTKYLSLAHKANLVVIDASKPADEVFNSVITDICSLRVGNING